MSFVIICKHTKLACALPLCAECPINFQHTATDPPSPAAPESETPETEGFLQTNPLAFDRAINFARSLERRLSLAQTEIKGYRSRESDLDIGALQRALDEAQSRIAELEKDAARYRWLNRQDNFLVDIEHSDGQRTYRLKCGGPLDVWLDARIAIDAAFKDRA